jgi:hypothetical protein
VACPGPHPSKGSLVVVTLASRFLIADGGNDTEEVDSLRLLVITKTVSSLGSHRLRPPPARTSSSSRLELIVPREWVVPVQVYQIKKIVMGMGLSESNLSTTYNQ